MLHPELAIAAAAGGCVLSGWLAGLVFRRPADLRAREELLLLRERVDASARRAGEAEALVRLHAGQADLSDAARRRAELLQQVAEAEAAQLRELLGQHEATPCALCGLPLPLCVHGREERIAWLQERGGGFPVQLPPALAPSPRPALPARLPPWREETQGWREAARLGAELLASED